MGQFGKSSMVKRSCYKIQISVLTLKLELEREMIRHQGKVKKEEGIIRFISNPFYLRKYSN